MTISNANIDFNEEGTPIAQSFDDVYFSNANGLEETNYVFIQNNQLLARWQNWQSSSFVIAETGFGTGLNFLATWLVFREFKRKHPNSPLSQLHFISTEKFPISIEDLRKALGKWPNLADLVSQLIVQYPLPLDGCHRMQFDQASVVLDLWLGDVHDLLPDMHSGKGGIVDCWFLDGFAPSKNPDMWTDALYEQMARLSKSEATFATFTAAGIVKRGLKAAGFEVQKRKGFGRKRDMLAGVLAELPSERVVDKVHFRHGSTASQHKNEVTIIGAGLAGANLAYSLVNKGFKVIVHEQGHNLANGASGNPQGGFYPQLNAELNVASRIQALSFQFAINRYRSLLSEGFDYPHQWCGVLQLAFNEKVAQRQKNLIQNDLWPKALIQAVSAEASTKIANIELPYSGLYIPNGGWINPPALVAALLQAAKQIGECELITDSQLTDITFDNGWQCHWNDNTQTYAATLVFAAGAQSHLQTPMTDLPFRQVRGQVEAIPTQSPLDKLTTVICHKGYLTPAYNDAHALGSTYVKNDMNTQYRLAEQSTNLAMNQKALSECDWAASLETNDRGRAAIRCSTPDHLPVCGAVPDYELQRQNYADLYKALPSQHYGFANDHPGLFVLSGLGSRGLTTAPLMAEVLASQIANQPLPMANSLLKHVNPNRFLVRDLIRRNDSSHKTR